MGVTQNYLTLYNVVKMLEEHHTHKYLRNQLILPQEHDTQESAGLTSMTATAKRKHVK